MHSTESKTASWSHFYRWPSFMIWVDFYVVLLFKNKILLIVVQFYGDIHC